MQTAEQVIEAIRRMPPAELEKIRKELGIGADSNNDQEESDFLKLAGSLDLGKQKVPVLDREAIYEERFE